MFALVLVGALSTLWEYGPLVGAAVLVVVTGWTRSVRSGMATAAFTVAALVGHQPFPAVVALAAALVWFAHDVHARRPGEWFPLLATGLGLLVAFLGEELQSCSMPWDDDTVPFHTGSLVTLEGVEMSRAESAATAVAAGIGGGDRGFTLVVAVLVALGLGLWAWRTRSPVVVGTAAAYLAAAWYLVPEPSAPGMQFLSQEQFDVLSSSAATPARPEVVLLAGAALAFALTHGRRDWVPLAVVGPLSTLWDGWAVPVVGTAVLLAAAWRMRSARLAGAAAAFAVAAAVGTQPFPALVALAGALVISAHDRHARRPGAWFPLLGAATAAFLVAALYYEPVSYDFGWFAYTPAGTQPDWHMGWTETSRMPQEDWITANPLVLFHPAALLLAGAAVALALRDRRTRALRTD